MSLDVVRGFCGAQLVFSLRNIADCKEVQSVQNFGEVQPVYGTSVYVKDGDSWKLAFSLNRLD